MHLTSLCHTYHSKCSGGMTREKNTKLSLLLYRYTHSLNNNNRHYHNINIDKKSTLSK